MAKRIPVSQFNKRVEFGTIQSVYNRASGTNVPSFASQMALWAKQQRRSLNNQYKLMGTELQDSIVVIIRHNDAVNRSLLAKMNGTLYDIADISPDDSDYMSYDYLTLSEHKKV
ncbi:hypothetical protein IWT25_02295 [Secundilactobacillus pentosiphilus]|uniref:Phage head-tail joining protein n=1 Tax=Secundilactobacillus pentosiphilus TaxID=1714682 RepID=A0A1Z5IYV4_9LACO|nr:phage head closure protein [Secundilactobacillus pentosiphilus]GAX06947.1 hypothetical protein IWT25_02295 [Secundilactobacillus pentosiphilus]